MKPVLVLGENIRVEVTRLMDFDNDEAVEIFFEDFENDTRGGAKLNFEEMETLIGFLRGN